MMERVHVDITDTARERLLEMEPHQDYFQYNSVTVKAEIERQEGCHADIIADYRWDYLGQKCGLKRRHRMEDLALKGFTLVGDTESIPMHTQGLWKEYMRGPTTWTLDAEAPASLGQLCHQKMEASIAALTVEQGAAFRRGLGPKAGKAVLEYGTAKPPIPPSFTPKELTMFAKFATKPGKTPKVGDAVRLDTVGGNASQIMGVAMGDNSPEDGTVQVAMYPGMFIAERAALEAEAPYPIEGLRRAPRDRPKDPPGPETSLSWLDRQVEEICKLGRLQ